MRLVIGCLLVVGLGCAEEEGKGSPSGIVLPKVYPPVRDVTPTGLIANAQYAVATPPPGELGLARQRQAAGGASNLATAVQQRFYSGGPTDVLRIVSDLDQRVLGLDTDPSAHECLTAPPVAVSYALPAGQSFSAKLQCLQTFPAGPVGGAGWVAFGFDQAAAVVDAGPVVASEGNDFYLVEGQANGMGGVYHVSGATGSVEAWIAVADRSAPLNSQVIMHLLTDEPAGTLELALAGSAVGFCSGHLKANADHLFVSGRMNAPPPPGAAMSGQYCDVPRAGCFAIAALATDLGEGSASCSGIGPSALAIRTTLDASTDAGANVTAGTIHQYFGTQPSGVPAF
jgi:hypothetical protein